MVQETRKIATRRILEANDLSAEILSLERKLLIEGEAKISLDRIKNELSKFMLKEDIPLSESLVLQNEELKETVSNLNEKIVLLNKHLEGQ